MAANTRGDKSFLPLLLPYSRKISRDPIFEDFKVFCLTSKILSSNFFKSRTDIAKARVCHYNSATSISKCVRMIINVECSYNKWLVITGCDHMRLAATVDCSS